MASSKSVQDESNPALWLATRAGKMELSFPLGTTRLSLSRKKKPYNKSFIDQACSVKMAWYYWPRSFFFACLLTSTPSRSINTQKKELGQYPAILTSHLVNNPYILHPFLPITATSLQRPVFSVPKVTGVVERFNRIVFSLTTAVIRLIDPKSSLDCNEHRSHSLNKHHAAVDRLMSST